MHPLPKAIIFDLDGTLLNTIDDLADSCNHALSMLGYPSHQTDKYLYFVGNGISILAKRILPKPHRSPEKIKECVKLISAHYEDNWKSKTTVYAGIKDLLKSLQIKQIPINILSNKKESCVLSMVEYFLGDFTFNYIRGAIDQAEKKPDPVRTLELAHDLQVSPEDMMFIGDSKVDMQTAKNAKMTSVGVTWGFRSKQELQEHDAQIIIDTPMEFWQWIEE